MLVNKQNLNIIFTGLKRTFQRGFELADPMYQQVAMVIPSNTKKEQYDWLGVAPQMREWVGDRQILSLGTHQYTVENKDWEQTVGVERNDIEDDTIGLYSPITQRMGEVTALHPDGLVFDMFNNGRAATSLGYDGVPFFSTSHPNEFTGTVSNLDSGGGGSYWYLADLRSAIKPIIFQNRKSSQFVAKTSLTDDNVFWEKMFYMGVDARYNVGYGFWQQVFASNQTLNEANLEAAWEAMWNYKADNGEPMNVRPSHLIVSTNNIFDAKRLVEKQLVSSGETNIHSGTLSIISSQKLTNV